MRNPTASVAAPLVLRGTSTEAALGGRRLEIGEVPGRIAGGSLVDVTPTILYFLGLPVARDMDGSVRTDMFDTAFNGQRTITFIPYDW